jgi:RNA polymerase-binding transcription factor DksA
MIETAAYKAKLEDEFAQIRTDLSALGIHNPEVKEDWIALPHDVATSEADENVSADRTEDWLERNATLSALETRYNNIARALKKIEDGTYGVCEISGEEIEEDRLHANPAARTCKAHINDEQDLPA